MVECDSVETSSSIYDQLDGTDASFSIDGLDLRYIPNEMPPFDNTFPRPPRDVATEASARGYEAPISFGSSLRHTRVKCTWDETPTHRTRLLRRKLSTKEMVEMDFNVSWLYGHGDSVNNREYRLCWLASSSTHIYFFCSKSTFAPEEKRARTPMHTQAAHFSNLLRAL